MLLPVGGGLIADGDHQPTAKSTDGASNINNGDRQARKTAAHNTVFLL
jgi:hypothetical protein